MQISAAQALTGQTEAQLIAHVLKENPGFGQEQAQMVIDQMVRNPKGWLYGSQNSQERTNVSLT